MFAINDPSAAGERVTTNSRARAAILAKGEFTAASSRGRFKVQSSKYRVSGRVYPGPRIYFRISALGLRIFIFLDR